MQTHDDKLQHCGRPSMNRMRGSIYTRKLVNLDCSLKCGGWRPDRSRVERLVRAYVQLADRLIFARALP
jgi:hypothetical protein